MTDTMSTGGEPTEPTSVGEGSDQTGELRRGAVSTRQAMLYAVLAIGAGDFLANGGAYFASSGAGNASWLSALGGIFLVFLVGRIIVGWSRKYVVSGSLMSYIGIELGPRSGLFAGAALLVGYTAAVAIYVVNVLYFGISFLNGVGVGYPNSLVSALISTGLIALMIALVRRGITVSVKVTIILGLLIVPVAVVLLAATLLQEGAAFGPQLSLSGYSWAGLVAGVVMMFGFYAGFEGISALAKETADPKRTVPLVINTLVLVMGLLVLISIFMTLPLMMENSDAIYAGESPLRILADAGRVSWLGPVGDGLLTLALFGSGTAYLTDASRVTSAGGRSGLLPSPVARVHPRFQTPSNAIVTVAALALAMVVIAAFTSPDGFFGSGVAFTQLAGLAWLLAYTATGIAGTIVGRRENRLLDTLLAALMTACLVGIIAYQLTQNGVTFSTVFSWVGAGLVPVIWALAVARNQVDSDRILNDEV